MVEFLKHAPHRPEIVAGPPADSMAALVDPGFERGEVFLRDEDGRVHRLVWSGEEDDSSRRRGVAPGRYTLVGYRIVAQDGEDTWQLSASGKAIRKVSLEAAKEARLRIGATIHMRTRLSKSRVGVAIQGEDRAGLTIYRNGKRIPIGFVVRDDDGERLAEGSIEYG